MLQGRQEKAFFSVARKNRGNCCRDSKIVWVKTDTNPWGLLLVAVGGAGWSWVELLLPSRLEDAFLASNNVMLKAAAILMAQHSVIINRVTAGVKPGSSWWTVIESHGEADTVMLWVVKK